MKEVKETKQKPTLEQIQKEMRGTFAAIGVLLNECFYTDSGSKLIGATGESGMKGAMNHVDLEKTVIGRYLPIYYAYAYEGRLIPGYEDELLHWGWNIDRLADFAVIFGSDGSYFDLCLDVVGIDCDNEVGYLQDMIDRLRARHSLDSGYPVHISDVSILAEMSERSVKNALTAEGAGRLVADKSGNVENAEAKRWLEGRRGFVATNKREFPELLSECPEHLDELEIPAFVRDRFAKCFKANELEDLVLWQASNPDYDRAYEEHPEIIQRIAEASGLPERSIQDAMQQPLRIRPEDCPAIAKAIAVDPVWFTMQVMRALFPTQMDMLLNPTHYQPESAGVEIKGNSIDVILTEAMIKHGYLDLPSHAKAIFPADCFGTREKGDTGKLVELRYGGQIEETDIRIKSEQTISPRKRFAAWLQKELSASPGDRIRFTRTGERTYELTHFPR